MALHTMLDGAEPDEPEEFEARRLIVVARIAKEFGVLPTAVARDLDDDPAVFTLLAYEALQYAEAKTIFDNAKDKTALERYTGDRTMKRVEDNTFAIHKARLEGRRIG